MDENKAEKWAHNADMFIGLTPYLGCQWCGPCIACVYVYNHMHTYIYGIVNKCRYMPIYADMNYVQITSSVMCCAK